MDSYGGGGRQRWTESRRRKEPTLYDEWLSQEKATQAQSPRRQSVHLRHSSTAGIAGSSAGTIRAVSPDTATDAGESSADSQSPIVPERGTASFERAFIPHTTTTIVGGPAALSGKTNPYDIPKARRLVKDRYPEGGRPMASQSPPDSRNGSVAGMLARTTSRSNGHRAPSFASERDAYNPSRPRTKTLEERRRERSSSNAFNKSRTRIGSLDMPSPGAEYLASVPASTSPPAAPSIKSFGSSVQSPGEIAGQRSISPVSSSTVDSMSSNQLPSGARRILHLMKTLNGRMSGNVVIRRNLGSPWTQIYCYIEEKTGRLLYEPRGNGGIQRALLSSLRGCIVRPSSEGDTPYLEIAMPRSDTEIHLKLLTQADFDSWYAALLYWQSLETTPSVDTRPSLDKRPSPSNGLRSLSSISTARPELPPRTSSAREQRTRAGSAKSEQDRDRRKSGVNSLREAPVIKIGNMIYWDTNIGFSNSPGTSSDGVGRPSTTGRPQAYRMQSHGSRRWRRISGQLRENGELKLHADVDNSLMSVVQLSQLSRCAIQRLDPSVLESEYCIAIYPQYTSNPQDSQPGFLRPTFLSLENRVLYEVWFVLLRAFTIPQLYGPQIPTGSEVLEATAEATDDVESLLATGSADMFRMERTLNIRIVEAKMFPPKGNVSSADTGFSGGYSRTPQTSNVKPEQHGYYAEVLLDNETRAKTIVKSEGLNPLWGESFDFLDLPPVLTSASVIIKRRPPESAYAREQHESKLVHEAYGFTSDQHGGYTGLTFDVTCGKVEIYLQELEEEKEVEKWWPVVNMYNQRVGEVLIKARAEEGVILMERDYRPLGELLQRFSNGLTIQIAQMVPNELKRVSDALLNIYQVSGKVCDWLMALVEDEIDGIHKETPISRLRYNTRVGSDASHDSLGTGGGSADRELIVRDLNRNATLEANLLFRGNTLLTKSLDTHMRRVGKEYLEESLRAKVKEINDKAPDCEVDPNRVASPQDLDRNWRRLLLYTQEVWKSIVAAVHKCPVELRRIFRHIRACAEDRYGDFLRSVTYSSVSGFLFLRFFCPAVLNPKLFGLLKEDVKPRARRTFTLIAKSLQTLSNMASFGTKETWMEPMNAFLMQHRESFKTFINNVCYVPTPLSTATYQGSTSSSSKYAAGATSALLSAETNLSYTTPITIMQRLPPTSREGFPSLPYLIDQARAYAELVQLWLEATTAMSTISETTASAKSHAEVMAAIKASEGDLMAFHDICASLHRRTQECLNRAERAERPNSSLSFRWEELIDQLQTNNSDTAEGIDDLPTRTLSIHSLDDRVASDLSIATPIAPPQLPLSREWDVVQDDGYEEQAMGLYEPAPIQAGSQAVPDLSKRDRPGSSSVMNSLRDTLRRNGNQSRASKSHSQSASASASNVSSTVSSDTEQTAGTTALPNYEREMRHRERREAAKVQIKQEVEATRMRENNKERRRARTPIVMSALRKKKERDSRGSPGPNDGYD